MEPTTEQKRAIVLEKIKAWENTYYYNTLDVRIGQDTGDDGLVTRAQDNMRKCLRAVQILEEVLTELEDENDDEEG